MGADLWRLRTQARQVFDYDFRSLADGVAVPYGIYDLHANLGTVFVGESACWIPVQFARRIPLCLCS